MRGPHAPGRLTVNRIASAAPDKYDPRGRTEPACSDHDGDAGRFCRGGRHGCRCRRWCRSAGLGPGAARPQGVWGLAVGCPGFGGRAPIRSPQAMSAIAMWSGATTGPYGSQGRKPEPRRRRWFHGEVCGCVHQCPIIGVRCLVAVQGGHPGRGVGPWPGPCGGSPRERTHTRQTLSLQVRGFSLVSVQPRTAALVKA